MDIALAVVIGALFACALHLFLQPNLLRMVFGLSILSNAVNLLIMRAGRITGREPALVEQGASALSEQSGNPLPQAFTLTAVVIGFGLLAFVLVLVYRSYPIVGTIDTDAQTRED
jgi:multicomponent Na+:H+ antiporter subunit C